jgi:hypothetical protein
VIVQAGQLSPIDGQVVGLAVPPPLIPNLLPHFESHMGVKIRPKERYPCVIAVDSLIPSPVTRVLAKLTNTSWSNETHAS